MLKIAFCCAIGIALPCFVAAAEEPVNKGAEINIITKPPYDPRFDESNRLPSPQFLNVQGDHKQDISGMVFPANVGPFNRVSIVNLRKDGSDQVVTYTRIVPGQEIGIIVYAYPGPPIAFETKVISRKEALFMVAMVGCQEEFKIIKETIMKMHEGVKFIKDDHDVRTYEEAPVVGQKATYEFVHPNFFGRGQKVTSQVIFYCHATERWSIKFRIDYPSDYDGSKLVESFIKDLPWTFKD